jgi:ATP-dependent helicase/nuclease subunit B
VNLYHIAPGRPFLDAIARHWLAQHGAHPADLARGLILLPTRRAARALAESFLRAGDGRPMLLPRIAAMRHRWRWPVR